MIMEVTPDSFPKLVQGRSASKDSDHDLLLRKKSKELEAVFLTRLFKVMEKTIPRESTGQNLSTMMFSSVMGDALAESGGIGLSDMIYRSLSENESTADKQLDGLKEVLPEIPNSVLAGNLRLLLQGGDDE